MGLKNNKKHKQQMENNNNENKNYTGHVGEDYISNLPGALIHHILFFLPTKSAMSTCTLSKRWKYVAVTIPVLDFRHWRSKRNRKRDSKLFMTFLDKVIYVHDNPSIQKFYLGLDEVSDEFRVYGWISTIMKRKVQILRLYINCSSTSSIFPLSFFTCDSLTQLDLDFDNKWTVGKLIIPSTVSFPKLKKLRLRSLSFVDETSTRKLFSNCPILEKLRFSGCSMSEGLCIVNPSLKHLSIKSCKLTKSTMKISAANLWTISYTGDPPADFVLDSFPSLVEADVGFDIAKDKYSNETFVKLFKTLSSVKVLKVSADSFLGIDFPHIEEDDCWSLNPKCSLPHLKSIKFKHFEGEQVEVNAIKAFLKYPVVFGTVTIVASPSLSKKCQLDLKKLLRMFPEPSNCVVKFLMSSEDT